MHQTPSIGYEWRFRFLGTNVEVQPFFWLVGLLLLGQPAYSMTMYLNQDAPNAASPVLTMLVVLALFFVSILLHEMGHVLAFRYFGIDSKILLHGLGGLAIPTGRSFGKRRHSRWQDIYIAAAGPFAQVLLAGVLAVICLLFFNGMVVEQSLRFLYPRQFTLNAAGVDWFVVFYLTIIANVYWVVFNLLPILPMDGGLISAGICKDIYGPHQGRVYALWISVLVGALIAFLAFQNGLTFAAFFVAYMAFQSLQEAQSLQRW